MNKLLPGFSEGFPVALRVWLVFLLCLVLLGYSVPFSIVVGAVGGIASGWVVAWWNSKDQPSPAPSEPQDEPEEAPVKLSGLALAKQRRDARARKRVQKSSIPLTGLLNRSK
ncbi:MAG: hypothetical protein RIG63_08130 [Coleofasciculus chthonoplastes F3-SA18-01]|uniref:hypothetical protein n=1 Tax=Coleofasciculus chthonoplastes TaxID=64178 RepID=UPI0032F77ED3